MWDVAVKCGGSNAPVVGMPGNAPLEASSKDHSFRNGAIGSSGDANSGRPVKEAT